ncbi:RsbRD N-terminal domain-containing protein [Candidatus Zixiibacteriota bacterium]
MGDLIFQDQQGAILEKWRELILNTYPHDTAAFLHREKDRFANPVGHVLTRGTARLLEALLSGEPPSNENVRRALDEIIKIRAVQDFPASRAVEFIFSLKDIVRGLLVNQAPDAGQLRDFDRRVDRLGLAAFDIYTQNRQKIFDIRVNEIKNRSIKLLERTNLMFAESGTQTDSPNSGTDTRGPKGG